MTCEDVSRYSAQPPGPGLRRLAKTLGTLGVVLGALITNGVVWIVSSLNCSGFGDSPPGPPADASPQGWLCGQQASVVGEILWNAGFGISLVATIVLIVRAWRRASWRLGVPALALLVLLPWATAVLMNLPPDDCSTKTQATHQGGQCDRPD